MHTHTIVLVDGDHSDAHPENVVEAVAEECTQNGIEEMNVDGAKGGLDDENEVLGTSVQDAETEVVEIGVETEPAIVGIETEVNNDADNDEVKEHHGDVEFSDHSENDPMYMCLQNMMHNQVTHWQIVTDLKNFNPFPTVMMKLSKTIIGRDLKWAKIDNIRARTCCKQVGRSWEIYCQMSTAFRPLSLRSPVSIRITMPNEVSHNKNQPNYMSFIPIPGMLNLQDLKN
ncbi:hypothetical protein JHK86_037059 [Glycine max]|nr:hypothetical protein JHK86_037059 [Glycine max]